MLKDFSGRNLCGWSFRGQDLTGANFHQAHIKGANFTNAILKDANFSCVKAGLQKRWLCLLFLSLLLLAGLSGIISGIGGYLAIFFLKPENSQNQISELISGITILISLLVLLTTTIYKGFAVGLGSGVLILIPSLVISTVFTGNVAAIGKAFFLGAAAELVIATSFVATALSTAGAIAILGCLPIAMAGTFSVAIVSAVVLHIDAHIDAAVPTTIIIFLFGNYTAWRAMAGAERFSWIRNSAVAFAAIGGTSFRYADLTDANFTQAMLKSTDFRGATLTHTRWYEAKKLEQARVGNSILTEPTVRDLLVSGKGYNKSYIGINIKGANLTGANLNEANLKEADISQAKLQGAILEGANLTKTQAIGTDFTSAYFTGACLEGWNIDSTTKLDQVDCRWVYLLEHESLRSNQRSERRPSSGEFAPGEFTKLFEEVLNTVDLIFRDGVDWKAFVTAFKKVQVENEGTELAIQSIENKGDGVVVVRVSVPPDANKEKIHSDFTQNYELALKAVEEKYKAELKAKDDQIEFHRHKSSEMKEIIGLLASRPVINEVNVTAESKAMNESTDASRKIQIGDVGGDFKPIGSQFSSDNVTVDISGTVAETINQLPTSPEPDKPGIKELLTQLQTAIEADTNLSEEDKAEALEQLKAFAEAGKNPQEGAMQKTAKTAMKILKGTIASLPSAATLVEACNKLLPVIASLLGLG
jgi:uncharacterized protein YjbI with pentapeptide repeats